MPRGRHRHSPPLHRLLAPASVAAAALAFAGGSWLIGDVGDAETVLLRGCAAAAAAAAVTGAVLLRRWDRSAGRRVGEFKARLAGAEWRSEERHAELEGELDEVRAARDGMARKVREKRAELAKLRTEHAALLRRYAHAESERAGALEGRRQLELESGEPAKALSASVTDHRATSGAPTALTYLQADEALKRLTRSRALQLAQRERAEARERLVPAPDARATASAVVPPSGSAASRTSTTGRTGRAADGGERRGPGFDFFGSAPSKPEPSKTASEPSVPAPSAPAPAATAPADTAVPGTPEETAPAAEKPEETAEGRVPAGRTPDDTLDIAELRSAM